MLVNVAWVVNEMSYDKDNNMETHCLLQTSAVIHHQSSSPTAVLKKSCVVILFFPSVSHLFSL